MMTATETAPSLMTAIHRLTVDQYLRMIDAEILTEADRVEFIDGLLVSKMTRKPPHDFTLELVEDLIRAVLPPAWRVRGQKATALATGMPEPDVAVVRGPASRYRRQHPRPADIGLVIEVADSSLRIDRTLKGPSYAAAGIPVYWIVNVNEEVIEVYTHPVSGEYTNRTDYVIGQAVPVVLGGTSVGPVAVADVFPPADADAP
jgi:Uma2 family endonuclease